jgi:hypothetical protein
MAYSDFTLNSLEQKFGIEITEQTNLFSSIQPVAASNLLKEILQENLSLALAINTEKARSELIIAPILVELRRHFDKQISLFSGIEFNIDPAAGLNGFCDYVLSRNSEQLYLKAPVAVIVEAKKENLNAALPQCIAEMIAAQRFNQQQGNQINRVYGVVTIGNLWKFCQLEGNRATIDLDEYYVQPIDVLLGILAQAVKIIT